MFWLRADGGLALFLLLLFFVFIARGDHLSEMSNRVGGVACLVVVFLDHASPSGFVCLFVFVSCCVCLYVYFLVALHLYIWGNIVLNTCMAFVVIKIVSLVSLFVFVFNCQRHLFKKH